eukprot:GFUD01095022.1.p1 GENE.GFUD01095022.1~~GFUD01095022.1.p1  ORF type:complete len:351 (+),score=115.36 GFUD01095022.1:43-1053(+)
MGRECCGGRQASQRSSSQDMDRKYIPSEDMGDYEEYRKKKKKTGPLYPLDEEGTYGAPPSALPPPLPGYQKRERKPKVYASYAVSSDCCLHADKLAQNETDRGKTPPRTPRKKSSPPSHKSLPRSSRSSSQPKARSSSFRLPSPAPSADSYGSRPNWKNSLRSSESPARTYRAPSAPRTVAKKTSRAASESVSPNRNRSVSKTPERMTRKSLSPDQSLNTGRRSLSSDGMSTQSTNSSTDWGYTSYSSFTANKSYQTSSDSKMSSNINTSFEESDEQGHNYPVYDKEYDDGGKMSLGSLKTPEISAWDNMGILGLSSKMFSSSSLMRRESVSSHAM